jgi:hypothetical protein
MIRPLTDGDDREYGWSLGGQNSAQAIHPERDTSGGEEGWGTLEVLGRNPEGQEKCKKSASRGTEKQNIRKTDPGLQAVIERWDSLPDAIRDAILALVKTLTDE